MNSYTIMHEWTLQEVIQQIGYYANPWETGTCTFSGIMYDEMEFETIPLWKSYNPTVSKDYIEDLWQIIISRFYDWNCIETKSDDISSLEAFTEYKKFFVKLANIVLLTYDKYAGLIKSFKSIQSDLMKQVNSTTETGYNDTPQSEGSYTDDTHRSSYTKVTSLVDGATPIERLNEINNKLKNIMLDWSNEFKRLFWEE